ncbi:protein unc-93 homolog A-like [Asterias rubens]|uniref:protein unc-93 homolog A-like n=1 Tax=Asterias rubens TaxID=7604 RepID=UPI00145596A2|nr:protein unc-93 homolog A-like [Asterias rubens]
MDQGNRNILKNLGAVMLMAALNSLCFSSLQSLQSSFNSSEGLGLASLSCMYAAGMVSTLLLAPVMNRRLGLKTTMIIGSLSIGVYAVSNFFPRFEIIIPLALLCGLGINSIWTAISTYLNTLASKKARLTSQTTEGLTNRYLALIQMSWQISYVVSTFLVSKVLAVTMTGSEDNIFKGRNFSLGRCGARDCGAEIPQEATGAVEAPRQIIWIFLGCFSACGLVLSPLVLVIFLDPMKPNLYSTVSKDDAEMSEKEVVTVKEGTTSDAGWLAVLRALKEPHLLMLMPLAFFAGVHFSFVMGDFTKSYVNCTQGIHAVGYVIMAFASADAVGNLAIGLIRQYVGRVMFITISGAHTLALLVVCLVWDPETGEVWHLYAIAVLFGYGDAVWQLQTRVFISVLYPDNPGPAFSAYYFCFFCGLTASFAVSIPASVCVSYKLYSIISLLLVSVSLYYVVEIRLKRQKRARTCGQTEEIRM